MKPGFFQGKKFPFTPKRRKKSLGSQCNNIIDTRHDLAAFRSKLANVPWLRSYTVVHAVQGHGESAEIVTVRVLAASERDHTSGILAHKWSMEHGAVVGDDTPSGAIFISSDNVFEDPDAATDALQRHREAKKLKV